MNWKEFFYFGEDVKRFDVRVLNEREIRAGAGVLFLLAIVSFMYAYLLGDFTYLRFTIVVFLIDFTIRVWINPRFAPSFIFARLIVGNQKPEYVGAPQKRFAWMIGFLMAVVMFFVVVVYGLTGPFNMAMCLLCLTFLFCESVFGICIGCKLYPLVTGKETKMCGGGVCEVNIKEKIQKVDRIQISVLIFSGIVLIGIWSWISALPVNDTSPAECDVPDWARAMGHEEQYKLHHNCL